MTALEACKEIEFLYTEHLNTDANIKMREKLINFILQVKVEGKTEKEVKIWMSQNDYKEFIRFKLFQKFIENEL